MTQEPNFKGRRLVDELTRILHQHDPDEQVIHVPRWIVEELLEVLQVGESSTPSVLTDEDILDVLGHVDPQTKRLPPGLRAFAHAVIEAHEAGREV